MPPSRSGTWGPMGSCLIPAAAQLSAALSAVQSIGSVTCFPAMQACGASGLLFFESAIFCYLTEVNFLFFSLCSSLFCPQVVCCYFQALCHNRSAGTAAGSVMLRIPWMLIYHFGLINLQEKPHTCEELLLLTSLCV